MEVSRNPSMTFTQIYKRDRKRSPGKDNEYLKFTKAFIISETNYE